MSDLKPSVDLCPVSQLVVDLPVVTKSITMFQITWLLLVMACSLFGKYTEINVTVFTGLSGAKCNPQSLFGKVISKSCSSSSSSSIVYP